MPERRRLRDLRPTGGLRILRLVGFALAMGLAATAGIALMFATHVITGYAEQDVHYTIKETNFGPWVIAIAMVLVLWWGARGRLLRTVLVTPLVTVGTFIAGLWVVIGHLLMRTTSNAAEATTLVCFISLFLLAPAMFILEWIVVVLERKKLEREDPVFPTARVVR